MEQFDHSRFTHWCRLCNGRRLARSGTGSAPWVDDEEASRVGASHELPADRGAAAVEFALVLPLLFTLLFGIVQYGYGFFQLQAAQATVHQAARRAALGIDGCTGIGALTTFEEVVNGAAEGNGLALADITVRSLQFQNDGGTSTAERGGTVTASVTYEPGLDFPLIPYPEAITRSASTTVEDVGAQVGPC